MTKIKPKIIFGIDPGLETIGYGCIKSDGKNHSLIDGGIIKTSKNDDMSVRLVAIHKNMTQILSRLKPDIVCIERLFFFRNTTSAFKVSQAHGVMSLSIATLKLPTIEYTPLHIKGVLTGYGRAEKKQVQEVVQNLLNIKDPIKDDNHADALAVALTHALQLLPQKPKP